MRPNAFFLLLLFSPILGFSQISLLNPDSGHGLRYQRAQLSTNKLLLSTSQPYWVELNPTDFSLTKTIEIAVAFRPEEFYSLNDSTIYSWSSAIGIPPNNSNSVLASTDGGVNWSTHPFLRTFSGQLHFIDSNFIIDGRLFLESYTLDGGQTYILPDHQMYEMAGIHDSGVYLYEAHSDSLLSLSRTGIKVLGVLDTNFLSLRHLYRSSGSYIALSDSGNLISLDTNFQYQNTAFKMKASAFWQGQFFTNKDTMALLAGDSIFYSNDAGLSWSRSWIPSLQSSGSFYGLALVGSKLLFANGAGGLVTFNLIDGTHQFLGGNDYPLLNNLQAYSGGFYGLERNNLQLRNHANFHLYRIDTLGNSLQKTALAFLNGKIDPQLHVLDSLRLSILSIDSTFYSTNGGQNWTAYPNSTFLYPLRSRKAEVDTCLFAYELDVNGVYLARISSGGSRNKLNFNFSLNEKVQDLRFWDCDTGIIITNADIYSTVDGGQSFSAWNQGYIPLGRAQYRSDTLYLANEDFNYFLNFQNKTLVKIDSQPVLASFFNSYPYFFLSKNKVISYLGETSKIVLADRQKSYYQELDIPVDRIVNFYSPNNWLYAISEGGGMYRFSMDSLFPDDLKNEDWHLLDSGLCVWPNPIKDGFHVKGFSCRYFKVLDLLGKELYVGQYDSQNGGLISGLKSGVYILQCFGEEETVFTSKIYFEAR